MGFNTAVFIYNDHWWDLDQEPEKVWEEIKAQINNTSRREQARLAGSGIIVMSSHHAGTTALIAVGGNHFTVVHRAGGHSHHTKDAQIELCRDWAHELGFNLHKRRKKK
jgi:hypothetical protein